MASNGHGTNAVPNGTTTQLSHRPQTPAYTIGNQFVAQYYMVLHNTPDVLHRFYTDDSTVTHSDCGSETEPSSSVTVTTQKDIRQRMQDMNFTETKTEIWSVDSQYSSQNGVMVLVTGLMEIKGKKQRDFIQSFFLATQEKGYYVLNDTLRFLSNRFAHPSAQPKENYSTQHNQALQTGLYHQPQPAPAQISSYYTQDQQQHSQQQAHHAPYPGSYQDSTPNIPAHVPISNHLHHQNVPAYATTQRKKPVPIAPPTHNAQFEEAYGRESLDKQEPAQPPKPTPAAEEPPKPTPAPAPTPTPPAEPPKEEPPKPAQVSAQPEKKPEPVSNPPVPIKAPAAEKPAEKQKPAEPPAPLTYADRLRMNAAAASQKATASSSANRVVTSAQQPRPAQASRPSTSPPIPSSEQPSQPAEPQAAEPAAQQEPTSTTSPPELSISGKEEEVLTSIFVRNLPDDITAEKLQEVFSEFGTIKNGLQGINLKQQKHRSGGASGSDFAFVDFEEQSAMQAAIAAKVVIDEKPVTVMERRPLLSRGYGSRGGRGDGRGFRGRSEGRGRGGRDSRPHTTGGRSEAREPRPEGGRGGRGYEGRGGEGGRGRGDRGRGRYGGRNGPPPQSSAAPRQQAAEA